VPGDGHDAVTRLADPQVPARHRQGGSAWRVATGARGSPGLL